MLDVSEGYVCALFSFLQKNYEGPLWDVCHEIFDRLPNINRENQKNTWPFYKKNLSNNNFSSRRVSSSGGGWGGRHYLLR